MLIYSIILKNIKIGGYKITVEDKCFNGDLLHYPFRFLVVIATIIHFMYLGSNYDKQLYAFYGNMLIGICSI